MYCDHGHLSVFAIRGGPVFDVRFFSDTISNRLLIFLGLSLVYMGLWFLFLILDKVCCHPILLSLLICHLIQRRLVIFQFYWAHPFIKLERSLGHNFLLVQFWLDYHSRVHIAYFLFLIFSNIHFSIYLFLKGFSTDYMHKFSRIISLVTFRLYDTHLQSFLTVPIVDMYSLSNPYFSSPLS